MSKYVFKLLILIHRNEMGWEYLQVDGGLVDVEKKKTLCLLFDM